MIHNWWETATRLLGGGVPLSNESIIRTQLKGFQFSVGDQRSNQKKGRSHPAGTVLYRVLEYTRMRGGLKLPAFQEESDIS